MAFQRIDKESIEKARQLLLSKIYRGKDEGLYVKRQAIKELLAQLIAARESGLTFEEIAASFKEAGLELSALTLRTYYFDLKTKDETAKIARKHADKIAKTKLSIDKKMLELHSKHAEQVAFAHTSQAQKYTKFFNALATSNVMPVSVNETPTPSAQALEQNSPPPLQPYMAEAAIIKGKNTKKNHRANASGSGSDLITNDYSENSLDVIESLSMTTDSRSIIEEDLLLRDGHVFYVSGQPFFGTLSKKQIYLLRSTGKIIAPTKGRSSADFVTMPNKL